MTGVLETVLGNAILISVLAPLVCLVSHWCRRPAVAHALWVLLLVKLITPGIVPVPILPRLTAQSSPRETPSAEPGATRALIPNPIDESQSAADPERPLSMDASRQQQATTVAPTMSPMPLTQSIAPRTTPTNGDTIAPASATDGRRLVIGGVHWLVAIWCCGSVGWSLLLVRRVRRFQRALQRATPGDAASVAELKQLAAAAGLKRIPQLRVLPAQVPPFLWSVGSRALLVVPEGLFTGLSRQARQSVLLHELAHFRRGDNWVRLLEVVVTAIYWWHPVLWWSRRELRAAEEQCCDAWAVARLNAPARAYAAALIETLEHLGDDPVSAPSLASGMGSARAIRRRVTRVMDGVSDDLGRIGRTAVFGAALMLPLVPTVAGLPTRPSEAAHDDHATTESVVHQPAEQGATLPVGKATASVSQEPATQPDRVDEPEESETETDLPKVVALFPPEGAIDVKPVTELRVKFDRPMAPGLAFLIWKKYGPIGYRHGGRLQYNPETYQFILPVCLTPNSVHEISLNEARFERFGFQSTDGVRAAEFSWSFQTAALPSTDESPPRVVAVDPPPDTEVALYNNLKVRFDQPMDPNWYGIAYEPPRRSVSEPELHQPVRYDASRHEFELPVVLPTNWNGEISLVHFRGANANPIEPLTLQYRTLRSPMSDRLRRQIGENGKSQQLVELIERIAARSRQVRSVSVRVELVDAVGKEGWSNRLGFSEAHFVKQGEQFYPDVSKAKHSPWQIGSDGSMCWLRRGDALIQTPAGEIAEKNVVFCDPFGAAQVDDVSELIVNKQLEYLGEVDLEGRRCYRIRSWSGVERYWSLAQLIGDVIDWYLDAETLLLTQIMSNGYGARFRYDSVNEEIPAEQFQPPSNHEFQMAAMQPLDADYTRRFVAVTDGTHGMLQCRWGRKGPKGTWDDGLSWGW